MILFILFFIAIIVSISVLWGAGIAEMAEKHPDYEGDDFLE